MARQTVVQVLDDIDGTANASEVSFSFDGVDYTIDLAKKNRAAMEKALRPYLASATKVSRRSPRRKNATPDLTKVRQWAKEQGIDVAPRGRVAQSVIDQYQSR